MGNNKRVLTFNLHTQYLYLLSHTGWDIENLIVTPLQGQELAEKLDEVTKVPPGTTVPWHTQPYGYPTHPGAVNRLPGLRYGGFFPEDISVPPALWMAPPVTNIKNVTEAKGGYDLVIYIEANAYRFYNGPAGKRILVNLVGQDHDGQVVDDVVCHRNVPWATYFPIGIPDDFQERTNDVQAVLCNFGSSKLRSREARMDIVEIVSQRLPFLLHDMLEDPWDYWQMRQSLSTFQVLLQIQNTPGGPPLSTVEAMTARMPVVAWDPHNHLADAVSGEHLFRADNPQQALVACMRLLKNEELRQEMGEAAREYALEQFSIEQFVEGWKKVAG